MDGRAAFSTVAVDDVRKSDDWHSGTSSQRGDGLFPVPGEAGTYMEGE